MCALVASIKHYLDIRLGASRPWRSRIRRACASRTLALGIIGVTGSPLLGCAQGEPIEEAEIVRLDPTLPAEKDAGADGAAPMAPEPPEPEADASAAPPDLESPMESVPPPPEPDAGAPDAAAVPPGDAGG